MSKVIIDKELLLEALSYIRLCPHIFGLQNRCKLGCIECRKLAFEDILEEV